MRRVPDIRDPRTSQITMPPKRRRQIAASLNYRKRKDREEMRVEGESTSGEARVEGGGEVRVMVIPAAFWQNI